MVKPRDLRDGANASAPAHEPKPGPASEQQADPADPAPVAEGAERPAAVEQRSPSPGDAARAHTPVGGEAFHFRLLPTLIAGVVILCLLPPVFPSVIVDTLSDLIPLPVHGSELASLIAAHIVMLFIALGAIYGFKRMWPQTDFGLHLPHGRSFIGTAIILGVGAGIVMALIDHVPNLFARTVPSGYGSGYGVNMSGWLLYQAFLVGPTEEIPFRSLIVTLLTRSMPGRVRYRGFEMNGAGVVVAALFTVGFGLYAMVSEHFLVAVGQIAYMFFGNVALAYWLEKSRSILAPIVGHSLAMVTWQALVFAMVLGFR